MNQLCADVHAPPAPPLKLSHDMFTVARSTRAHAARKRTVTATSQQANAATTTALTYTFCCRVSVETCDACNRVQTFGPALMHVPVHACMYVCTFVCLLLRALSSLGRARSGWVRFGLCVCVCVRFVCERSLFVGRQTWVGERAGDVARPAAQNTAYHQTVHLQQNNT